MPNIKVRRASAFTAQQGRCVYCGCPMWLQAPRELLDLGLSESAALVLQCTAEHLHARRNGGSDAPQNIVAACLLCNGRRHRRKAQLTPRAFKTLVERRLQMGRWHSQVIRAVRGRPSVLQLDKREQTLRLRSKL